MCGVEEGRKGVSSSVRPFLFFDNKLILVILFLVGGYLIIVGGSVPH